MELFRSEMRHVSKFYLVRSSKKNILDASVCVLNLCMRTY